jgi:hypothetical protein
MLTVPARWRTRRHDPGLVKSVAYSGRIDLTSPFDLTS